MADDFDVEAMLEAPYKKDEDRRDGRDDREERSERRKKRGGSKDRDRKRSRSRERKRGGSKDRERRRSRDRERKRSRSRDRKRSRSRERRDKHKRRSRSRSGGRRDRRKSRERERERRSPKKRSRTRSRDRRRRSITKSPIREVEPDLTPEERDARTVFCMQLSARIRPRDLEEFFSSVGKVKDVRLITDNKTRRSKGISYVEFVDTESVALALHLTGQRLLGVPILVQASQAERNRLGNTAAAATTTASKNYTGPMRLYVGSLHFNITDEMLRGIFEPFGKIDDIKLIKEHETSRSQGYGFITFNNADDARKALEQLNGFELAGRPMKVGHVTERVSQEQNNSAFDSDEMDRAGIDLGATGRLQLMAKLAEGTGFQIPQYAANALNMNSDAPPPSAAATPAPPASQLPAQTIAPPIATQCFMLSNMFDPATVDQKPNWDQEIRDEVIDECNKHGGVIHMYVDKASPTGNVYIKCPSIAAAVSSVNAIHGRYFGGKMITAAYVPLPNYHQLFPESHRANQLLLPSTHSLQSSLQPSFLPSADMQMAR